MPDTIEVFVISLAHESARRERINEQLGQLNVEFSFFDALKGSQGFAEHFAALDENRYVLAARRLPTPGEIGCYASHKALWQRSVDTGRSLVIIEDDATFTEQLPAAIDTAADLVGTCGFIRLERNKGASLPGIRRDAVIGNAGEFTLHYLHRAALCTTAYAISPAAAARLLQYSATLIAPADRLMQQTWLHGQPLFMLSPPVASQQSFESSLESGRRKLTRTKLAKYLLGLRRLCVKTLQTLQRWWFNRTVGRHARRAAESLLR